MYIDILKNPPANSFQGGTWVNVQEVQSLAHPLHRRQQYRLEKEDVTWTREHGRVTKLE